VLTDGYAAGARSLWLGWNNVCAPFLNPCVPAWLFSADSLSPLAGSCIATAPIYHRDRCPPRVHSQENAGDPVVCLCQVVQFGTVRSNFCLSFFIPQIEGNVSFFPFANELI
jgi:hypothetical protein